VPKNAKKLRVRQRKQDGSKRKIKKMATPASTNPMADFESACNDLVQYRQRPLLVLYYPGRSSMTEMDMSEVYQTFRNSGVTVETKVPALDVLIDSYGGNPVAGYRLAQLIRDMTHNAAFMVAERAYSAATLLCLAGNEIRLGHYAGLSPIDITLVTEPSEGKREEVELATVDGFIEFAKNARKAIEEQLRKMDSTSDTNVDSELLVAMVRNVGALQVGKFFRERNVTGFYAKELLGTYMFSNFPDRVERTDDLVQNLLHGAPSHYFHLDYHLCKNWKVVIEEMCSQESDLAKKVVEELENLTTSGVICQRLSRKRRMPFFGFYAYTPASIPPTGVTIP
jgi:hypothetical protein